MSRLISMSPPTPPMERSRRWNSAVTDGSSECNGIPSSRLRTTQPSNGFSTPSWRKRGVTEGSPLPFHRLPQKPPEPVLIELQRIAGYLVVESRPLVHATNPGGRTAGMNQVTCISRKPGMSDEDFYGYWHSDHKRVAFETQSTTGYVRNEFVRALTPGAPDGWIAIVEETFPIGALDDPKVFYDAASDEELKKNLDRMMASCDRFLDMGPLEFTHMSEYYLG